MGAGGGKRDAESERSSYNPHVLTAVPVARKGVVAVDALSNLSRAFWTLVVGAVVLYAFFALMGALTPADHVLPTAIVAVLIVLLGVHLIRVRHAMQKHSNEAEMRELHKLRERRGF
jgi:uncharacterized membrane protein